LDLGVKLHEDDNFLYKGCPRLSLSLCVLYCWRGVCGLVGVWRRLVSLSGYPYLSPLLTFSLQPHSPPTTSLALLPTLLASIWYRSLSVYGYGLLLLGYCAADLWFHLLVTWFIFIVLSPVPYRPFPLLLSLVPTIYLRQPLCVWFGAALCGLPAHHPVPFLCFLSIFRLTFCSPSGLRWISLLLDSPASTSLVQVVHVHVGLGADPWIQGLNCVRMTTFCTSAVLGSLSLCAYCTADVASAVW